MGSTPAGRRDRRIAFERENTARTPLGTVEESSWSELGRRWAKVTYGGSQERRSAAIEQAQQSATFRVLDDSLTRTITAHDRINHSGNVWDIGGVAEIRTVPPEIEFTAVAAL